ncbi:MAG: 1-(5-phosphoribosyl)-5-[(5-phosphoribosylamino)methylideneamino]imidazole-4-carboxamide isomerase [Fidelibacterota bacterium]|nr:MAG: 1-(5-phosphoribosyl)-5-[(5-phosphoribosylamino)methylideneamino]imidazole-4-carboxamide isomerase [Candidatus Neomarinimicrobiota bacterium]
MGRFSVIPAMDLMDGCCVRLVQGRFQNLTSYAHDPVDLARTFLAAGLKRLHMVDLDGARLGRPMNLNTVAAVAATGITIELGGGMRTEEYIQRALDSGVQDVVLGTHLFEEPERLSDWVARYPGRLIAGVDARDGQVVIRGWQEGTDLAALDLLPELERAGFSRAIYTDVATDGTLQGPNLEQLRKIAESTTMAVTASGGIGCLEDIQAVKALEGKGITGVIVGKAFYEGKVTLEVLAAC